jgi:hypothetical protein
MALQHINASTQTTATILHTVKTGLKGAVAVQIYNGHSAAIFIGDSTVTTSGATIGRTIAASGNLQLWLNSGDQIYAISAAASASGAIVITYSA